MGATHGDILDAIARLRTDNIIFLPVEYRFAPSYLTDSVFYTPQSQHPLMLRTNWLHDGMEMSLVEPGPGRTFWRQRLYYTVEVVGLLD